MTSTNVYDTGGNSDGKLDPGETADITVTLFNIGGADAVNCAGMLTTSQTGITIPDNYGVYGTLQVDSTRENLSDPFVVSASSSTPEGTIVDFELIITADGGYNDTLEFSLIVGQPLPYDNERYYVYYSNGPHSYSPVFDWIAIDSTQTTYPGTSLGLIDNQTVTVSLPFTFQYYGNDYTQVSISSNGWAALGLTSDVDWTNSAIPNSDGPERMIAGIWDDLDPGNTNAPSDVYYYDDAANHRFIIEYFKVEHWPSSYEETFEIILYDPVYYPTPTDDGEIIIQYLTTMQQTDITLGIENQAETVGIMYYFDGQYHPYAHEITDEYALRYTTWPPDDNPGVEESGQVGVGKSMFVVAPNITNSHTVISYTMPLHTHASFNIYDASGRLVRSFDLSTHSSSISWDCRDMTGRRVAQGIYFVTFNNGDQTETAKVIVVD
jgi:hypothetical protein